MVNRVNRMAGLVSWLFITTVLCSCNDNGNVEPDPEELPEVTIDDLNLTEADENVTVTLTVSMSDLLADPVIVYYKTENGGALAGEDFVEIVSDSVVLESGDFTKTIDVEIIGDLQKEGLESFKVVLFDVTENATILKSEGIISISDTDIQSDTLRIPETGYETPMSYEGMSLVWNDEFEGASLNLQDWTQETGGNGWGNNELEYYTTDNTSIVDGNLVIEARRESRGSRNYTSARIITRGKQEFLYGRIDIRAVLPQGQGIWPALWMLGGNIGSVGWPSCGEIDIMEMIGGGGRENTTHGTIHWSNTNNNHQYQGGSNRLSSGTFSDEFHVFSIIWNEEEIVWLRDDTEFHSESITPADRTEFHKPHFLIFNVAVGGNWPGNPNNSTFFPQRMIVDYVRVFQPE